MSSTFTMEPHNEAYFRWRERGVKDHILVHFDTHIDFGPAVLRKPTDILNAGTLAEVEKMIRETKRWQKFEMPEAERIHIGNFLYPAITDGIVRLFCWVVPDVFFHDSGKRRLLKKTLSNLQKRKFLEDIRGSLNDEHLTATLCGKEFIVTSLAKLPCFKEKVLLDVDTDFFISNSVWGLRRGYYIPKLRRPWIWPEELMEKLGRMGLQTEIATIAFSVEGGFTPLWCRHLGEEMADLLGDRSPLPIGERVKGEGLSALRREGIIYKCDGRDNKSIVAFERALAYNPNDAPSLYNLAVLLLDKGQKETAHGLYQSCIEADTAYRSEYATNGVAFEVIRRYPEAETEYRKALVLDPSSSKAHTNLANMLFAQKKTEEAEKEYKVSLSLDKTNALALKGFGLALMNKRRYKGAVHYLTEAKKNAYFDPSNSLWLGVAYAKLDQTREALQELNLFVRSGRRNSRGHLLLALVYFRLGLWYKALREIKKGILSYPRLLMFSVKLRWLNFTEC